MSKLRNVRSRQWERYALRLAALTGRCAPYLVTEADGYTFEAWPLTLPPGYSRQQGRTERRRWRAFMERSRRDRDWVRVEHTPRWEPADLPINAAGDTRPGFVCVHPLENGNGPCGGDIFDPAEEVGNHACIVRKGGN